MKKLSFTRKILTVVIGTLFSLSLILLIFWVPIQNVLIKPEPYKQAFSDQRLYQKYPVFLGNLLTGGGGSDLLGGSLNQLTSKIDPTAVDQFVVGMIPPDWFRSQVETNLDLFFSFLNGNSGQSVLKFDLRAIKMNLQQDESVLRILRLLPACTSADLTQLLGMIAGQGNIPICRVPDQFLNLVLPLVKPILSDIVTKVPDQLPLMTLSGDNPKTSGGFMFWVMIIRETTELDWIFYLLPILFFLGLLLISQPGWKAKFRNLGIFLIIAGSVGLVFDLVIWAGINSFWTIGIEKYLSTYSNEIGQILGGVFRQVFSGYVTVAALLGFVFFVCGVILVVVSRTMFQNQPVYSSLG